MTIETWLPALLGYLIPLGFFLLAWGGMAPERARRSATVGSLALALATLGYFAVGFAFHLGGAGLLASEQPGLSGLNHLLADQGDLSWGLVGLTGFFMTGPAATPEALSLFLTYLPMAATAVLLPVLSLHRRARGWQVTLIGLLVAALLFPVAACWVWGGGWLSNLGLENMLGWGHGFVDHAGSALVYLLGGMAALGCLLGLGQRTPRNDPETPAEMPPAHFHLLANLGALLFGLGVLGWTLSRPFHVVDARLNLPHIAVNVLLAGAGAILATQVYCCFTVGHADPLMSARGMVVGFVAIAAGAPFVPPWAALLIGVVAGFLLPVGVYLVENVLRLPDGAAAVPLAIFGGLWGTLSVALFADGRWGQGWNGIGADAYHEVIGQGVTGFIPAEGFVGDGPGQMAVQLLGLGVIALSSFLLGWVTFLVINWPYRPRPVREPVAGQTRDTPDVEAMGADETDEVERGGIVGWMDALAEKLFPQSAPTADRNDEVERGVENGLENGLENEVENEVENEK